MKLINLGTINQNKLIIGSLTVYFSYATVVAFEDETGDYCCVNDWSRTTGKLLNKICPDKKLRLPIEEFEKKVKAMLKRHNLGD